MKKLKIWPYGLLKILTGRGKLKADMIIRILELINSLPHWLATMLIAMMPVAELRTAIPIALGVYKMPVIPAVIFSIIGDMIPALLILLYIGRVSEFLRRHSRLCDKFFTWWFKKTEKKFTNDFTRYGLMALFLFVAIPFPGTGSWSGAAAAFLFGLPFLPSLVSILGGVMVTAGLVTGASLGVLSIF